MTSFEVFVDNTEPNFVGVGVVLNGASIIENGEGVLAPGCSLSPEQTRHLIDALEATLAEIDA